MPVATQPFTGVFVADQVHSSFVFTIKHMKVSLFRASFEDVSARAVADEQGIRFEGAARVESISIKNPPEFRQHVLYGADFLDATNYPEITFRSNDVQLNEDGTATLQGELTIKGITKPVSATGNYQPLVEDPYGRTRTAIEFSAAVDRRDWDMNWQAPLPKGGDALGYNVQLSAHVELVKEG